MTTQEIIDEVLGHQFSTERYTDAIVRWADFAQKYIVRQTNVRTNAFLSTTNLTIEQYDYALPADFARVINLTIYENENTDARFLRTMELEDYIIADSQVAMPTRYTLNRENLFSVYPAPDKAYFLDFYYYKLPATLSIEEDNVVNPEIPEDYHHLLIDYALFRVYAREHDASFSGYHKNIFDQEIMKMRGEVQFEDDAGPQVVEGTWANVVE